MFTCKGSRAILSLLRVVSLWTADRGSLLAG